MSENVTLDDLAERVTELEEELDARRDLVELRGVDDPADADVSDIWIAGHPVGKILDNLEGRTNTNTGRIEKLEDGGADTSVSAAADPDARSELLPVHLMWIDVREGREDNLDANDRRAARLFRRFLRRGCGEADTGVSVGRGSFVLSSDRAKDILEAEDTMPKSGKAKTIQRVYQRAQSHSKRESCDCDSLEGCQHGLFDAEKKNGEWRLRVDRDAMTEYLHTVEDVLSGEVSEGTTSDDGVENTSEAPPEQPDEITEQLDALDQAKTAPDGGTADSVVSGNSEGASARSTTPSENS